MSDLLKVTKLMFMEKKDIIISILAGFIAGIAAVGLFAASGYLISKAALAPPLYALIVLTSTVKLLGFVRAIARYMERYFSHRATFTILSNLRVDFFKRLEPLAPGIYQKYRSGDLLARIVGDVESLQNYFLRVFYPPIVLVMVFLATMLFTAYYSVYVALVLLGGLVLTLIVVPAIFTFRQEKINQDVRKRRGELSTEITELLYGLRDLKIYQKLEQKEEALNHSSVKYLRNQESEGINRIYNQSVNTFVSLSVSWLVLGLGAYMVAEGRLEGIFLAMLVMISLTVFEDAGPMAVFPIHLQDSRKAANRLYSVVGRDEEVSESVSGELVVDHPPAVHMDHVSFKFPEEWRKAVDEVTLTLPPGSKTAIVGPSGSGKSTILQLLLKMAHPQHGVISLNDTPVDQIQQESIWRNTRVVLQENHLFYGTVRENLMLAEEDLSEEKMIQALKNVKLEGFSLDDHVQEKGDNLSGGEKQRLAIARAMLKSGNLWLLDEPTSSVDALTEQHIHESIFSKAAEDTIVLVSHRLAGLDKMDQIIVMEHGQIIESGTFNELMTRKGYFYQMKVIEKNLL
ncbi:thiol reductant ABC exporter subunit CydC [Virgibacillus xinjiangensis]|uniref:Thiol reductant ABC exporter subunit CydC n=1 Tax=Virgibacillus xinjiangensis TaxID=393090 RepID=A0ABV7CZ02_9BACI